MSVETTAELIAANSQPQTWYEVVRYSLAIKPITVLRFTDKCIWVPGVKEARRQNRAGEWSTVFPSKAEAIAYAKDQLQMHISNSRSTLENWEQKLIKLGKEETA
jgi:hypothetical protein